jgi:hypothetical protein
MRNVSKTHNYPHVFTFEDLVKRRDVDVPFPLHSIRLLSRSAFAVRAYMIRYEHAYSYVYCDLLVYDTMVIRRNPLS